MIFDVTVKQHLPPPRVIVFLSNIVFQATFIYIVLYQTNGGMGRNIHVYPDFKIS